MLGHLVCQLARLTTTGQGSWPPLCHRGPTDLFQAAASRPTTAQVSPQLLFPAALGSQSCRPPLRQPRPRLAGRWQRGTGSRRTAAGSSGEKSLPPPRVMPRCPGKLVARKGLRESPGPPPPATPADPRRANPPHPSAPYLAERRGGLPPASPAGPAAAPGAGDAEPGPGAAAGGAQRAAPRGLIPAGGRALPALPCLPCPRGQPRARPPLHAPPLRSAPLRAAPAGRGGRAGEGAAPASPPSLLRTARQRAQAEAPHRTAPRCPRPALPAPLRAARAARTLGRICRAGNSPWPFFSLQGGPAGAGRDPPVAG